MTFSSDASLQAAELTGIRKTLRGLFPPVTDGSAAMGELLAAIDRAYARSEATRDPDEASPMAGLAAAPRPEARPELRA